MLPLLAVLLFSTWPAHGKKMALAEVPPIVAVSIKSHYPDAKNILINKELHFRMNLYEVKFKAGNHQNVVLLDRQGKPFGSEENIDTQQLPLAVNKKLQRTFANFSIQNTRLLRHPDGRIEYDIDVTGDGSEWELAMTPGGNIVAKNLSEM
ncbi:MAG: PepSY-like domain-containing protein [Gammaproteobacteria bacterium]